MDKVTRILALIDEFDARCQEEEYTDTGDVWDLLRDVRTLVDAMRPAGVRGAVTVTMREGESSWLNLPTGDVVEVCFSSSSRGRMRITIVADRSVKIDRTRK